MIGKFCFFGSLFLSIFPLVLSGYKSHQNYLSAILDHCRLDRTMRYCCGRKNLDIAVNNTAVCCESQQQNDEEINSATAEKLTSVDDLLKDQNRCKDVSLIVSKFQ